MIKIVIILSVMLITEWKEPLDVGIVYNTSVATYSGWLSAYDIEPSEATYEYRISTGDIEAGYDVYLAVGDCSRISETGTIRYNNGETERYQVFDCAKRDNSDNTQTWMETHNIVAELDYEGWQRHPKLGRATLIPD